MASWRQITVKSVELDRRHTAGVVNCWKQTATVEVCC